MGRVLGRYNQFKRAVENVKAETWTAEEFQEFLFNIYENLGAKANELREIITTENYSEYAQEEVECGLAGLNLFEAGMQEMALYLEDWEIVHLDEGLALIWEGNEKINEAMSINRKNRDDLDVQVMM
ncbi:hypothetical protein IJT17_03765 [bacterium]|nr:hypothetical protein [bacterium]